MFYNTYVARIGIACLWRGLYSTFVIVALLLAGSFVAEAATQNNTLSLTTVIQRVQQQHPALKVFEFRRQALDGAAHTQALTPGYDLGFDLDNVAGSGEYQGIDSAEFSISLSSVIEMGDKLDARSGVVSEQRAYLEAEHKIAALNLLAEATRRYIDVLAAQSQLQLASDSLKLAEQTLEVVSERAKAGVTPDAEVKRARAAVFSARLVAETQLHQLDYAKLALSMMWGESQVSFDTLAGSLFAFSDDVALAPLFEKVKYSPAIAAYLTQAQLKEAELRFAKTQSTTDIKWSVGVKQLQQTNDMALTAGFNVPLFNGERNTGAVMSAQAAKQEVLANREVALLELYGQLYRAYTSRKQAIVTVNRLQASVIPTLTLALEDTKIAYEQGLYSYLDYLTAREELLFARRALIDAAASALRYGVDIEQLIAEPLPASQHSFFNDFQGQPK
ncbi:outer membrane efflux protein [Shewanella halifaxensis HAW-EB4]|uniref:Outer membrane efflux protein n=1 Tax=Shewanella halifaxensis (strain HAW-EB4) TaxID=458817 RepID=B0TJ43_SHEHH|nr:TolC family protein [Shewanella halifaxensis]ABZ78446.1 outer membrane efflux protein [Shewanella halifaxensis HAW-EB4]